MHETKPLSAVIGCGIKGADWVIRRNTRGSIFGLDREIPKGITAPLVRGDVFNLPIRSGTIDQIYGDFIVNGLAHRDIAAAQIIENPDILDTNYFPSLVRQWFIQSLH